MGGSTRVSRGRVATALISDISLGTPLVETNTGAKGAQHRRTPMQRVRPEKQDRDDEATRALTENNDPIGELRRTLRAALNESSVVNSKGR